MAEGGGSLHLGLANGKPLPGEFSSREDRSERFRESRAREPGGRGIWSASAL